MDEFTLTEDFFQDDLFSSSMNDLSEEFENDSEVFDEDAF